MNIVDAVIIIFILIGVLDGLRKGAIRSLVELFGSILVIFLSWILKGTLSNLLIKSFPQISANPAISVIVYQVISFIALLIIFDIIYKVILKASSFIEKVFDTTIVLGAASRIIGSIIGFVKMYVIAFFVLFILSSFNISIINDSKVSDYILKKTPLITPIVKETWETVKDVYGSSNIEESIQKLFESKIINEDNMNKIMEKYRKSEEK